MDFQNLGFEARGKLRLYLLDDNTFYAISSNGVYASDAAAKSWRSLDLPEL